MFDFPIILKATYGDDDLYLDEDGKHIIFRNVRGKIVPIHVDSSDYVDWLRDKGIPIDNTSQENMTQAEGILDYLDRVREIAGPEMAAKYEAELVKKYKEYYQQASGLGYAQVQQKQAAARGMTSDELQAHHKKLYEDNKHNMVKASTDREGEWASFISEYCGKMLNNAGSQDVSSNEWGIIQAFDLSLMLALDKAKKGEAPVAVDLLTMLKAEAKSRELSSKLFAGRYDPKVSHENSAVAAISLVDGIENLIHNLETSSAFGKQIETAFDRMYVRMFNDYDKPNQKNLSPLAGNMFPSQDLSYPDELPDAFDTQEANRLVGLYKSQGGSKVSAAHKVMIHTLGRLWEQIPEAKRVAAFQELDDDEKGIHKIHKLNFIRSFQDSSKGLREYNPDRVIEEALREALHVKDTQNYNEIVSAIKAITVHMAHLDGYYASKSSTSGTPSQRDVINLWNNSPVAAGRAQSRGEGPNLMQFFGDEKARESAILPNSVLKVVHKGKAPKGTLEQQVNPAFNGGATPPVAPVATPPDSSAQPSNSTIGWRQDRNKFIDDSSGLEVTMTPIKLPSGATALKLSLKTKDGRVIDVEKPLLNKGKSKEDVLKEVVGIARTESIKGGTPPAAPKPTPAPTTGTPTPTPTPRSTTDIQGKDETIKLHKEILDSLVSNGFTLKHVTGSIYAGLFKEDQNKFHRVAIDKNGKVVVTIFQGGKWVNHYVSTAEEANKAMGIGQSPLLSDTGDGGGVETQQALAALSGISQGDAGMVTNALAHAVQSGLNYRVLGSTKTVRIQNKNNKDKGYISLSNTEGVLKAHLITPDGGVEEIPVDKLAERTAQLL